MWFYLIPHCIYHMTRWFPENNRIKFRVIVFLISVAIIIPEMIVLTLPKTGRACDQPLLDLLVASTIFVFFSSGFSVLFSVMDPIPRVVKIAFHVFGCGSFLLGLILSIYSFQANSCVDSTTELYYWCLISSVLALIASGYFFLFIPFWFINLVRPNSVFNWRRRSGICYEPVSCCSCFWHIS